MGGEDSKAGIEVRNAPGTKLRGNHITGGTGTVFLAIRLNEDRGADGRGKGIPSGIRIECNVIRQAANGIRIGAWGSRSYNWSENIVDSIDEIEAEGSRRDRGEPVGSAVAYRNATV